MVLKDRHALTDRQLALLQGIANGLSMDEISVQVKYSVQTLKDDMREILLKLGASNRTHAVAIAYRRGEIE